MITNSATQFCQKFGSLVQYGPQDQSQMAKRVASSGYALLIVIFSNIVYMYFE